MSLRRLNPCIQIFTGLLLTLFFAYAQADSQAANGLYIKVENQASNPATVSVSNGEMSYNGPGGKSLTPGVKMMLPFGDSIYYLPSQTAFMVFNISTYTCVVSISATDCTINPYNCVPRYFPKPVSACTTVLGKKFVSMVIKSP